MQQAPTGSSGSGGGGSGAGGGGYSGGAGESSRASGLARFRSAPATWLEALLEEEEEDLLKPNQCLTQLLVSNSDLPSSRNSAAFGSSADPGNLFEPSSSAGFVRQNSSPAEFLGNTGIGSDGYFSNFGISNFDYPPPTKRPRDAEPQNFSAKFSAQLKGEQGNQVGGGLSSLIDMEMEKILEDSVPCRVRAKRGCATHPRSIAERVRRTRISDRIRKLQDLVPNMDKQTNTADMLEEAVEYVKFLQTKIQELSEHQRRCKCTAKD